jgi:hypothetical protein
MAEENSAMVMSSNDNAIGSMAKASGAAANCAREKKENIISGYRQWRRRRVANVAALTAGYGGCVTKAQSA